MRKPVQPCLIGVFAVALALCGASPAHAQTTGALMKGSTLAALCNSSRDGDQFACQSYIAGVMDYHHLIKSLGTAPSVDFCIPPGTKMADVKNVVMAYISRHTEHQDFIAAPGVAMSLYNGFPCRKGKQF